MKTKGFRGVIGSDTALVSILLLLINLLFIYKYGLRQKEVNVAYFLLLYPIVLLAVPLVLTKLTLSNKQLNLLFFLIAALFFILSIIINLKVDGTLLNVDRWSALDVSVSALLDNQYPYTAKDHLGGYSSHLPTLLLLATPFYLLGDVGLLQSALFLFFVYFIYITIENPKARVLALLFLTLSVSYLWEIYVKSDLVSNFILIAGFISLWYKKRSPTLNRPILLGSLSGLLLLTRIVTFIPLSVALFREFFQSPLKTKIRFITSALITISILLFIVFRNSPSKEMLLEYNPFKLQGSQLPIIIGIILMVLPLLFSGMYRSLSGMLRLIILFLTIPVSLAFIINLVKNGFSSIIFNSSFDLSYFNMLIPFIVIFLALKFEEKITYTNHCDNQVHIKSNNN
jgi:hypothetical protein